MKRKFVQDQPRSTRSSARNKAPSVATVPSSTTPYVLTRPTTRSNEASQTCSVAESRKTPATEPALSRKRHRQDYDGENDKDTTVTSGLTTEPAPKRRKHPAAIGRTQPDTSSRSASGGVVTIRASSKRAASTRDLTKIPQQVAEANDDEEPDHEYELAVSSSLSDLPSLQTTSDPQAAQSQNTTGRQTRKAFAKPHKSPLVQQEDNDEAACDSKRKTTLRKKKAPTKPRKAPNGGEQKQREVEARRVARDTAKTKKLADAVAERELEKQRKTNEILALITKGAQEPGTWQLQLPALPQRQNTSGRNLPIRLIKDDPTFPLTHEAREDYVAILMDAIRDCRFAQDRVAITTNYWYLWLKPAVDGKYPYEELDMERVCRRLVNVAEALHTHGLGSTHIYCPETIKRAQAAQPMTFKIRIGRLALLMRRTKSRCNDFMLGNTIDDTIALIDIKLADQKSNVENNHRRSLKVEGVNQLLGIAKGAKWPTDQNGEPMTSQELLARGFDAPGSMAPNGVKYEHNGHASGDDGQETGGIQQPHHTDPASVLNERVQSHAPMLPWMQTIPNLEPLEFSTSFAGTSGSGHEDFPSERPETQESHSAIWYPPAGPQSYVPMLPFQMEPMYGDLGGGPANGSYRTFVNSGFDLQRIDPSVDMPLFHQHSLDGAFVGAELSGVAEAHPSYPAYPPLLADDQALLVGQPAGDILEVERPRDRDYPTFPRPIRRSALNDGFPEIGGGDDAEVVKPATKRTRRRKASTGS